MSILVPETSLRPMGHYPLARDTLFGFNLDRKVEEVEYLPQLGLLALNGEDISIVGFRQHNGDKRLLYSHPDALLGLPELVTAVEACAISLPDNPKVLDSRVDSDMSWTGRVKRAWGRINDYPTFDASFGNKDADLLIEPQPLPQAIRQAARARTAHIHRMLPSAAAVILNSDLRVSSLGFRT